MAKVEGGERRRPPDMCGDYIITPSRIIKYCGRSSNRGRNLKCQKMLFLFNDLNFLGWTD